MRGTREPLDTARRLSPAQPRAASGALPTGAGGQHRGDVTADAGEDLADHGQVAAGRGGTVRWTDCGCAITVYCASVRISGMRRACPSRGARHRRLESRLHLRLRQPAQQAARADQVGAFNPGLFRQLVADPAVRKSIPASTKPTIRTCLTSMIRAGTACCTPALPSGDQPRRPRRQPGRPARRVLDARSGRAAARVGVVTSPVPTPKAQRRPTSGSGTTRVPARQRDARIQPGVVR